MKHQLHKFHFKKMPFAYRIIGGFSLVWQGFSLLLLGRCVITLVEEVEDDNQKSS